MFDWNDLRHFLAVADAGTTAGAARALGTSQPTVVRRIAALEQKMRLVLFDRHANGYRLTPHGEALLPQARRIGEEMAMLDAQARAQARTGQSIIRLTMPEASVAELAPILSRFRERFPGTRIELRSDDLWLDIRKGEADIAVRAGYAIDIDGLVGTRLPIIGWALYASHDYVDRRGLPRDLDDLANHAVIGAEGRLSESPPFRWLERRCGEAIVWRSNVLTALLSAAVAGLGIAPMPCAIGTPHAGLEPVSEAISELAAEICVLTRPELRLDPAVKTLMEMIVEHLRARAETSSGRDIRLRGAGERRCIA